MYKVSQKFSHKGYTTYITFPQKNKAAIKNPMCVKIVDASIECVYLLEIL